MKNAVILHNPGAGDEEYSDNELVSLIEENGFNTSYFSLKDKHWKKLSMDDDFLIITGGDGSIRKVIKELINRQSDLDFPIAVIPAGTANNIAKTLGIFENSFSLVRQWHQMKVQKFDLGCVRCNADAVFFLEGFGYGLFPRLMKEMKKIPKGLTDTPEKKLQKAQEVLKNVVDTYKAVHATVTIDGNTFPGDFLMIEVMNIKSLGPNFVLAPNADPGDGIFEVALVYENQRGKVASYVSDRIRDLEGDLDVTVLSGKNIQINWEGDDVHVDDEILDDKDYRQVNLGIYDKTVKFLVS